MAETESMAETEILISNIDSDEIIISNIAEETTAFAYKVSSAGITPISKNHQLVNRATPQVAVPSRNPTHNPTRNMVVSNQKLAQQQVNRTSTMEASTNSLENFGEGIYVSLDGDDDEIKIVQIDRTIDNRNNNLQLAEAIKQLPFQREVMVASAATSVEPALIHAVIKAESNHNPKAISPKGAMGLMQLMPATARHYHVTDGTDPQQNIMAGAKLLKELLTMFNGDVELSLAAYNAGLTAVFKYGKSIPPYKETQRYVPKVLKLYRELS